MLIKVVWSVVVFVCSGRFVAVSDFCRGFNELHFLTIPSSIDQSGQRLKQSLDVSSSTLAAR